MTTQSQSQVLTLLEPFDVGNLQDTIETTMKQLRAEEEVIIEEYQTLIHEMKAWAMVSFSFDSERAQKR